MSHSVLPRNSRVCFAILAIFCFRDPLHSSHSLGTAIRREVAVKLGPKFGPKRYNT
jgi:hypothetical protein